MDLGDPPELDPGWLRTRVAETGLDAEFDAISWEPIGRFSNDVWRLRPLRRGVAVEPALLVKRPYRPTHGGDPPSLEARFYRELAAGLPVATPGYVASTSDLLVLVEVSDVLPFDFRRGPGPAHARAIAEGLAALHAATWNRRSELDWVPSLADAALRARWQHEFDTGWGAHRAELDAICPAFTPIGDALVGRLADTLAPLATPAALLHGDSHAENLPALRSGGVLFLDWQGPRLGNPGFDVAVFTAMSFPVADRRRLERALVEVHAEAVRATGADWPDPIGDYRLGLLRRAARIVEILATTPFGSVGFVYERCAAAAADHTTADLIR